jgi:hypothetical protein
MADGGWRNGGSTMNAIEIREAMLGEQNSDLFAAVLELLQNYREEAVDSTESAVKTRELWKAAGAMQALGNFRLELLEQMKRANEPQEEPRKP